MLGKYADYKSVLQSSVLFQGVAEKTVEGCLKKCENEIASFAKGDLIYTKERFKQSLGMILDGSVIAVKKDSSLIMSTKGVGEFFGAAALFQREEQFVAEIRAAEKCSVLFLSQQVLSEFFQKDFCLVENYIRFLSERLRFLNEKIDNLTAKSADSKVAQFLLMNCNDQGRVMLAYNFTKIAKTLCISRASLYRVIGEMEKLGLIQKDGKRIFVIKPEILKNLLYKERI